MALLLSAIGGCFRNNPVGVIGGGDSAMEEASFLSRYASKVYIIHRFDYLEASKVMQRRVLNNPKIEVGAAAGSLLYAGVWPGPAVHVGRAAQPTPQQLAFE